MMWSELEEGDVVFSKRTSRVYLVLAADEAEPGMVPLFDLYNGRRLTARKSHTHELNPHHYEAVKRPKPEGG